MLKLRIGLAAAACLLLAGTSQVLAQAAEKPTDDNPVVWDIRHGAEGDAHVVLALATIADGWYVYSQHLGEGGPIPTSLDLSATEGLNALDAPAEGGKPIEGYDELFAMNVKKFAQTASFSQQFTLPKSTERIRGSLQYMACTDLKCLPPRTIDIDLPASGK